ncbi:MAG TPA: LPS export ABC transporter periplasmic protein LptC [Rubrivivax sp.]|nr:LPS export ABC transporter periplasmic protein LptC [Burkholderiales bacterium]HNT37919.1 LPS export ABC transporter periplasmic protein LptC [Rubrivivax sp.]
MSVELHLPDLPEVPISLGPAAGAPPRHAQSRAQRLREALSTYLPLLLMALLALATWWLVNHTPGPVEPAASTGLRHDPDYTMRRFVIERFDRSGQMRVHVEGEELRHYPDTDRYEIDEARIQAVGADGRRTVAQATRALTNGDLNEVRLVGGARVSSSDARGRPLLMRSEFLHAFLATEQVRTDQPVVVNLGADEMRAAGMEYDHGKRLLRLQGRLRVRLQPPPGSMPGTGS